ncbi:DUF4395 domain-containing protein [Paenibacillus sp. GSMTC-2017]|uniref:DUF4395 domain-containing protein n=1 Tax=Paenibacillus sp. GSMTC-2017 TaxID=2794350 RepID=UPI0018D7CD40|nr:DUF4395 domain-containing protein [Paenibacillus sp. GSMTC-2017]MBH5318632.1 DUF4395 domain-containing protein [Paenibacillus sp. GSMTC-2017]
MKEIPISYVRSNQVGIVSSLLVAIIFDLPWLIAALFIVLLIGLVFGPKGNLFIIAAKPFVQKFIANGSTEAIVLQRFNNLLGLTFLTISLLSFLLNWPIVGYVVAGIMGAAALAAILGYCIGCTIYFQFKQLRAKRLSRG